MSAPMDMGYAGTDDMPATAAASVLDRQQAAEDQAAYIEVLVMLPLGVCFWCSLMSLVLWAFNNTAAHAVLERMPELAMYTNTDAAAEMPDVGGESPASSWPERRAQLADRSFRMMVAHHRQTADHTRSTGRTFVLPAAPTGSTSHKR